jgi:hypothetical protein
MPNYFLKSGFQSNKVSQVEFKLEVAVFYRDLNLNLTPNTYTLISGSKFKLLIQVKSSWFI